MKKTIIDYEAEIRALHQQIIDYPDSKTLKNRLGARLGKWQPLLDITVIVAKNEGKPWSPKELDMKTIAMHRKEITGFQ